MLSQRRAVRETDLYGKSADKFLSLIPECCRITMAGSSEREEEPAFWGKGEYASSYKVFSGLGMVSCKMPLLCLVKKYSIIKSLLYRYVR